MAQESAGVAILFAPASVSTWRFSARLWRIRCGQVQATCAFERHNLTLGPTPVREERIATAALTYYTPEEYLALERHAEFKSEYIDGRIVAMTGASASHAFIAGNVHAELRARLRGGPCRAWANDMRVQIEGGRRYTYPDVVAFCGRPRFLDGVSDTLTNPVLIVEVLSSTTEAYDLGEKFQHYRGIESLQEYVLVAQDRPLVERFVRHGEFWQLLAVSGLDAALDLASVGCTLPLREIYENVEFPAPAAAPDPEAEVRPS